MIDAGVVPIAAFGSGNAHGTRCGGSNGGPGGDADVDTGVELVSAADVARAVPGGDRAAHRPDQPVPRDPDVPRRHGACAGGQLLRDLLRDVVEVTLEVVLLLPDLDEGGVLLAPGGGELAGALLEPRPGRLELRLAGGDL